MILSSLMMFFFLLILIHLMIHKSPTVKFSYTFELLERATVQVEDFVDLVGIVGGTLGMFIGFAFYDNIMTFVEYVLTFVQWVKRLNLKRRTRKVAKV